MRRKHKLAQGQYAPKTKGKRKVIFDVAATWYRVKKATEAVTDTSETKRKTMNLKASYNVPKSHNAWY